MTEITYASILANPIFLVVAIAIIAIGLLLFGKQIKTVFTTTAVVALLSGIVWMFISQTNTSAELKVAIMFFIVGIASEKFGLMTYASDVLQSRFVPADSINVPQLGKSKKKETENNDA